MRTAKPPDSLRNVVATCLTKFTKNITRHFWELRIPKETLLANQAKRVAGMGYVRQRKNVRPTFFGLFVCLFSHSFFIHRARTGWNLQIYGRFFFLSKPV